MKVTPTRRGAWLCKLAKLKDLESKVKRKKRAVRVARTALQRAAEEHAAYIQKLNDLGIEVVEQSVEREKNSHG